MRAFARGGRLRLAVIAGVLREALVDGSTAHSARSSRGGSGGRCGRGGCVRLRVAALRGRRTGRRGGSAGGRPEACLVSALGWSALSDACAAAYKVARLPPWLLDSSVSDATRASRRGSPRAAAAARALPCSCPLSSGSPCSGTHAQGARRRLRRPPPWPGPGGRLRFGHAGQAWMSPSWADTGSRDRRRLGFSSPPSGAPPSIGHSSRHKLGREAQDSTQGARRASSKRRAGLPSAGVQGKTRNTFAYQILYQQIEIDTRQTRGRRVTRRTAYFAKQTTYFLWQKELRLISEVPGRPRSHD